MSDTEKSSFDKSSEFDFEPIPPEEQMARRLRLWKIGLLLGGMVLVILLLIVGMIGYSAGFNTASDDGTTIAVGNPDNSSAEQDIPDEALAYQSQDVVGEGQIPDHYRGTADNPQAVVVEYADFSCSHCMDLAADINDIYNEYGDRVQFIYRHYGVGFTYSDVTPKIAEAAYVVGGEDAYWKMQDKLFSDTTWAQGSYMDDNELMDKIRSYGNEIGIDGQALVDAYNNSANNGIDAKIKRDRDLASQASVSGTPTVFIGKESVSGTSSAISSKLDELLQ